MKETVGPGLNAACSFCGSGAQDVGHLFAGPGVWICDGCVNTCYGILQHLPGTTGNSSAVPMDSTMNTIAQVQQAALEGATEQAKAGFSALWDRTGPDGRPLHRVTIAHYLADAQDDPEEELLWNERALEAAYAAQSGDDADAVRLLLASLHLNTAQTLHRLGRQHEALAHLGKAEQSQEHLPPDGYGDMLRAEIAAFRGRMDDRPELPL